MCLPCSGTLHDAANAKRMHARLRAKHSATVSPYCQNHLEQGHCCEVRVCVCSAQSTDVASLAALPRYTCGQLYFYPRFLLARDGARLVCPSLPRARC